MFKSAYPAEISTINHFDLPIHQFNTNSLSEFEYILASEDVIELYHQDELNVEQMVELYRQGRVDQDFLLSIMEVSRIDNIIEFLHLTQYKMTANELSCLANIYDDELSYYRDQYPNIPEFIGNVTNVIEMWDGILDRVDDKSERFTKYHLGLIHEWKCICDMVRITKDGNPVESLPRARL